VSDERCSECGVLVDVLVDGQPCGWCESRARAKEGGSMVPMEKCSACGTVATDDGDCRWCAHLKALQVRIAELQWTCEMHRRADKTVNELVTSCDELQQRNMLLSDQAGTLHRERDELLKENAMLRREVERLERLERKAKR
jgi:FtsZ-binding cell division protein ZapB